MKIAIDCRMLNNSGIGNVLKSILALLPKKHTYLLIGEGNKLKEYVSDTISVLDCSIPIFSVKELFCFPVKTVNKCDVFFSPNYNLPLFIHVKKYCMIHDVVFLDVKNLVGKIGCIIRYLYLFRAILISKTVFTVSKFSKSRIVKYFGHSKKIKIINNPIPLPLKKEFSALKKRKETEPYFIYVGNVKKHKGIDVLIEAFKNLPDKNIKLYIVGKKDSFKTSLEKRNLQLNENIIFTGYVDDNTLYNLIYNAKALIQPSIYEGFGIPPLEALYLGVPAIISDIPVFKEIYGTLPVTFFKCADSADLVSKMENIVPVNINRKKLEEQFDFKISEKIIFGEIENDRTIKSADSRGCF